MKSFERKIEIVDNPFYENIVTLKKSKIKANLKKYNCRKLRKHY